jgi:hypothetical protein
VLTQSPPFIAFTIDRKKIFSAHARGNRHHRQLLQKRQKTYADARKRMPESKDRDAYGGFPRMRGKMREYSV